MTTIKLKLKSFKFKVYTGRVLHLDKGKSSTISGSYNDIRTTTTAHDTLYLIDENGQERSYELTGLNIAAREGHTMSVIWAAKENANTGYYVKAFNHTTNQHFVADDLIKTLLMPEIKGSGCLGAIVLLAIFMGSIALVQTDDDSLNFYPVITFLAFAVMIGWPIRNAMLRQDDKKKFREILYSLTAQ